MLGVTPNFALKLSKNVSLRVGKKIGKKFDVMFFLNDEPLEHQNLDAIFHYKIFEEKILSKRKIATYMKMCVTCRSSDTGRT